MHIFAKAGLGVGTIAGISGASYGIYNSMQSSPKITEKKETITVRSAFSLAILDFSTESVLINEKFQKLKQNNSDPQHPKLKEVKNNEKTNPNKHLEDFKKACQIIYDSDFSSKDTDIFKDFQSFCARTIKDKITKSEWATDQATWKARFDKLSKDGTRPTSEELKQIAIKVSQNGDELKNWCVKVADLVFEKNENLVFKDAQSFCGKND